MSSEEEVKKKTKKVGRPTKDAEYKEKVKDFLVRVIPGTSLYEVYFKQGGEIPKALKSRYTSKVEAERQIKIYKATRRQYY